MPKTPRTDEVRVPRLTGLMAVDAREAAAKHGVLLAAPDRPDFHLAVVDYVVRQYPTHGVWIPRDAVVTVWFELGPDDTGGAGVREPRRPEPPDGGLHRETAEPGPEVGAVW
ncbi:PASTA domain-containing protein [Streptomyces longisporoflavus]|uniref:PASTA domain-containing protein n=1 Tax=Streptomyces longisporoflavus TaxID=28044 RepID=UPI001E5A5C2A|nr:PASTA domain-containing protein [Streptomyces longisporoflavus]